MQSAIQQNYLNDEKSNHFHLDKRPRRNRKSPAIRALVQETRLHPSNFVALLFVLEGNNKRIEVNSMPGVFRMSIDQLLQEASDLYELGVVAVDLFPVIPPEKKDGNASELYTQTPLYFAQ